MTGIEWGEDAVVEVLPRRWPLAGVSVLRIRRALDAAIGLPCLEDRLQLRFRLVSGLRTRICRCTPGLPGRLADKTDLPRQQWFNPVPKTPMAPHRAVGLAYALAALSAACSMAATTRHSGLTHSPWLHRCRSVWQLTLVADGNSNAAVNRLPDDIGIGAKSISPLLIVRRARWSH